MIIVEVLPRSVTDVLIDPLDVLDGLADVEDGDVVSLRQELLDEMASDETGRR